jgi:hypothetical protein
MQTIHARADGRQAPTPFPKPMLPCTMRAPSPSGPSGGAGNGKKILIQGVDVPVKGCIMCGSLGHFADGCGTRR